ncbi:MAG: RNA polymerase sigma factor, partial [Planctomycetota bacterium]
DQGAFDALFARYGEAVFRRAMGMVHDHSLAQDIQQEVFLRLWTGAGRIDGDSAKAWLLTVATNLALNAIRSRRRRPMQPLASLAGTPDATSQPPDLVAERSERAAAFRYAVAALPAGKRAVVRLVHEERKELHEVARELGIPLGTVKSRLHYAMKRLAEAVRELGWDWEEE